MALIPGTRLGPYEVTAQIGAGGMGEVYRATDTNLKRHVAIKVLPTSVAGDADRLARFQREAQVLAALNHPNIAHIFGLEKADGTFALVMELVEGPTLADRIAQGAIPPADALPIAKQIAEALEAAHEQGIIHRDLKPANIKVRADGAVKVLDFGLAKALDHSGATTVTATLSPTMSIQATAAGIILGTAAYMSPEQARGKSVDTRTDIWAFGAVLFEMLAGRRPFDGDGISDIVAGILKSEPGWQALPGDTPAAIQRLLRRCLQKDRRGRMQHIGDARLEIEDAQRGAPQESAPVGVSRRERLLWGAAVLLAATAAAFAIGWRTRVAAPAAEMRLDFATPGADDSPSQFALSPDGRTIVFAARSPRTFRRQLWWRSLDATSANALPNTEGGEFPFWAFDNRSIGFFANNQLRTVDLDGGQAQPLASVISPSGGTWNRDGTILYVPSDNGGVFRVSAKGGESGEVTPRRSSPLATRLPQFLPDGRHFLFYVARGGEPAGTYIGELGTDSIRQVLAADGPAFYGSGHLWFVRGGPDAGTLFAQPFEPSTQELKGPVSRVADNVGVGLVPGSRYVSPSIAGPIAYRSATERSRRQFVWFDRSGKPLGTAGEQGGLLSNPSLSPDGRYLVLQRTMQGNIDLWVLDLQRNVFRRLTDDPGIDSMPVWSPDGNRVVFDHAGRDLAGTLAIMRIDGTSEVERLRIGSGADAAIVRVACDWSPDGKFILYKQFDPITGATDLWAIPTEGDRTPMPVTQTPSAERDGQFSPDSKWIAYESDESGAPEIYIQPFPGPGPKVRVSTNGGTQVRWRRDGKELFYIAPDESLMAVPIVSLGGAPSVRTPMTLFQTRIAPTRSISRQQYVVSPDGHRFLVATTDEPPASPITLIINWKGSRTTDSVGR